ncbi:MAG: hypothetical protein AVDCRST_MAG08-70 [uncultured Acetobacteraceae bacterium]|uniref:Uncharacterized protein n=1 Tax=uncultured Acetobacteraceae bacterium TaxID=169975 RepID=A0A6J4H242_9PROT|nr:MAG: hypothetical protein AVDCRST_MAG08-70 [uncultured Acetobacteraceae bacterium]
MSARERGEVDGARREGDLASSRRGRKAAAVAGPARGAG